MAAGTITQSNKTRADCRKEGFTGLRMDSLVRSYEIWVMGTLVEEVTEAQQKLNPRAIEDAYERTFGLHPGSVSLSR